MSISGRIQVVKTFIILILFYRKSLISLDKEFEKEANKIIFDFIWKGEHKVKRSALISDKTFRSFQAETDVAGGPVRSS